MQSRAKDLRTGSDQPQGRESDCNLPAPARDGPRKLLWRVEGLGAEEPKKAGGLSSGGAVRRKGSSDLSGSARTFPYCALISLAPKHSTQLFSIGRPQVFTAKLIRGYLRDKKQSASLASVHKEPPQKLQSKQVSSQEPALNKHSHDLFQVSLQLSLCSGGNRMGRHPRIGDALGRRVGHVLPVRVLHRTETKGLSMERRSRGAFKELVHEVDERTGKPEACRQGHRLGTPMGKAETLPSRQHALLLPGQGSPVL